jgi:hypothetical protein
MTDEDLLAELEQRILTCHSQARELRDISRPAPSEPA